MHRHMAEVGSALKQNVKLEGASTVRLHRKRNSLLKPRPVGDYMLPGNVNLFRRNVGVHFFPPLKRYVVVVKGNATVESSFGHRYLNSQDRNCAGLASGRVERPQKVNRLCQAVRQILQIAQVIVLAVLVLSGAFILVPLRNARRMPAVASPDCNPYAGAFPSKLVFWFSHFLLLHKLVNRITVPKRQGRSKQLHAVSVIVQHLHRTTVRQSVQDGQGEAFGRQVVVGLHQLFQLRGRRHGVRVVVRNPSPDPHVPPAGRNPLDPSYHYVKSTDHRFEPSETRKSRYAQGILGRTPSRIREQKYC